MLVFGESDLLNFIRPHLGLEGETPEEAAGIRMAGKNING